MKKFLLLLIIPFLSFGQSWKFDSGKSDFDGSYKTAFIQGKGNNFPYNKPVLTINKFSNNSEINFYISEGWSFTENSGSNIKWVFDNEPDIIYLANKLSYSNDGLIVFFQEFYDPVSNKNISKYEFINKLKTASKVSVRLANNYGKNDVTFTLKGSSKAIESVISVDKIQEKIDDFNFKEKQTKIRDKLLLVADEYKITAKSRSDLKAVIEGRLGIGFYGKQSEDYSEEIISTIEIQPSTEGDSFEKFGRVNVFYVFENKLKEIVLGYNLFKVNTWSPLYIEFKKEKEKEKAAQKKRIKNMLTKYDLIELQSRILSEITENEELNLKEISNVNLIFSEYQLGKFWKIQAIIYSNTNERIPIRISTSSLEINKKQLKKMGGKVGVEF